MSDEDEKGIPPMPPAEVLDAVERELTRKIVGALKRDGLERLGISMVVYDRATGQPVRFATSGTPEEGKLVMAQVIFGRAPDEQRLLTVDEDGTVTKTPLTKGGVPTPTN